MPIPLIAGLALGAGSAIFNAVKNDSNAATQYRRQQQLQQAEMDFNARQADLAYARQHKENELAFQREKDWLLDERAYNEPINQLNRLRAAGINPAVGVQGMTNTQSTPLDMSAASTNGASVGGSSAAMATSAQLPDLTNIMQGLKGLELANAQINESNQRQQLLAAQTANVNKETEKMDAYSPFWSSMARYDTDTKKYNSRSIYRDILEKAWKYEHLFPEQLKKMRSEINALDISNEFNRRTFKDRMNDIIYGNALKLANIRGIDSMNSYRDFMTTQTELNGAKIRQLYDMQMNNIDFQQSLHKMEKDCIEDLTNGRMGKAVQHLILLNFLKQAASGSLFNLPNPTSFGGDMGDLNKTLGALGFML